MSCGRIPCYMDSAGICTRCHANQAPIDIPAAPIYQVPSPVMGCICPPGANKECEAPLCPRRNPLKAFAGNGDDLNRPQNT